ncbi:MAG TPA: CBS domain-containing protein [Actinomycetota bacterium]|nr:CBS domain-containing protein [Actinomycetota bacterium]
MQVGDIMSRNVVTVSADDTFADAAKVLREHRISSVVVKADGGVSGIVTERDFVNLIADGLDPAATRIGDRMTRDVATVESRTDIAEAAKLMADRRIRHLPVVDRGELVGIISIRDLTSWAVEELTGGHELPDLERSSAALSAAVEVESNHP